MVAIEYPRHYTYKKWLASGNMADVFVATRTDGQLVACKMSRTPEMSKLIKNEAKLLSKLRHFNIIKCHQYGEDYLETPLMEGVTLEAFQREVEGKLIEGQAVRLVKEVLKGLIHAHAVGVIHRDIHPGNIFIHEGGLVQLFDFGAGTDLKRKAKKDVAKQTLLFDALAAPELHEEGNRGDHRSDLHSIATTLYKLTTGKNPAFGDRKRVTKTMAEFTDIKCPTRFGVSEKVAKVILKGMNPNPAERFQSAEEMLQALKG